ncbi:unnamed protein product, partial [marine sediment metagenome]
VKYGRHVGINLLMTQQYPSMLEPQLRESIDYYFISRECKYSNRRRIYDFYGGIFPNFEFFEQVFMEMTTNYRFMVIDNRANTGRIEDTVFWYKANLHPPYNAKKFFTWKQLNY